MASFQREIFVFVQVIDEAFPSRRLFHHACAFEERQALVPSIVVIVGSNRSTLKKGGGNASSSPLVSSMLPFGKCWFCCLRIDRRRHHHHDPIKYYIGSFASVSSSILTEIMISRTALFNTKIVWMSFRRFWFYVKILQPSTAKAWKERTNKSSWISGVLLPV
jgi:hypothetical protein